MKELRGFRRDSVGDYRNTRLGNPTHGGDWGGGTRDLHGLKGDKDPTLRFGLGFRTGSGGLLGGFWVVFGEMPTRWGKRKTRGVYGDTSRLRFDTGLATGAPTKVGVQAKLPTPHSDKPPNSGLRPVYRQECRYACRIARPTKSPIGGARVSAVRLDGVGNLS